MLVTRDPEAQEAITQIASLFAEAYRRQISRRLISPTDVPHPAENSLDKTAMEGPHSGEAVDTRRVLPGKGNDDTRHRT